MDKSIKSLIVALVLFVVLSGMVSYYLFVLCVNELKKEHKSTLIEDSRGPVLKELERKALAK